MTYHRIRLELARSHEAPEGSNRHHYEFIVPLDGEDRFDRALFDKAPELCTVHRFRAGEGDRIGQLVHARGKHWYFSFPPGDAHREEIHRFPDHFFRENEYLTLQEPDGRELTFKIVLNEQAPGLAGERPV